MVELRDNVEHYKFSFIASVTVMERNVPIKMTVTEMVKFLPQYFTRCK